MPLWMKVFGEVTAVLIILELLKREGLRIIKTAEGGMRNYLIFLKSKIFTIFILLSGQLCISFSWLGCVSPLLTFNSGPTCLTTCRSCVVYLTLFVITGLLWDFTLQYQNLNFSLVNFAREDVFHSTPVPLCLYILFTDFYTEHFHSFSARHIIWKPVLVWIFLITK